MWVITRAWFFQGRLTEFELYGGTELTERKIHKIGPANQIFAQNSDFGKAMITR